MVAESGTWTEEVVSGSEDDHCTSFLGGLCPRDREVCGACATTKFTKGDWGGSEDMVFPIERDGCGDSSLTQLSTPKEGAYGDHPDGRMERVSEVDAAVQGHEVLNEYWSMESTFVSCALFISGSASELDPVIFAIPRCMIDKVPAANAGHPGSDGREDWKGPCKMHPTSSQENGPDILCKATSDAKYLSMHSETLGCGNSSNISATKVEEFSRK